MVLPPRPSLSNPRSARHGFACGKLPDKWLPIVVLVSLLPLVLATGVAASSPQTTTVYYACVNNTTGAIQIVSSTTTCPTGTHKIHWNQQGPVGPAGPQGPQGPQGQTGPIGPA